MKINPSALSTVAFGSIGLYYAFNKKPPEWLLLSTVLASVVTLVVESQKLIINDVEIVENDCGCGCAGNCTPTTITPSPFV